MSARSGSAPLVVGYDGTDGSRAALDEAVRLAAELDTTLVLAFARRVSPLGSEVADLGTAILEHGRDVLDEGLATAGDGARGELIDGRPADALAALAEREGAQMVVVGCYGEPPLRGALLGSTPHRLLQQCPVPVLVVARRTLGLRQQPHDRRRSRRRR